MSAVGCMYYYMMTYCSLLLLHCHTYLAFGRFFPTSWGQLNKDSFIHPCCCNFKIKYLLFKDTQKETSEVIPIEDAPYIKCKINILQCKI